MIFKKTNYYLLTEHATGNGIDIVTLWLRERFSDDCKCIKTISGRIIDRPNIISHKDMKHDNRKEYLSWKKIRECDLFLAMI